MMPIIKKILYIGERIQIYIAVACLVVIVVSIAYGVTSRYFFTPVKWAEELSIFCFIWLSFMAAGAAYNRKKFIVSDLLINLFKPRLKAIMVIINFALALLFLLMATYATFSLLKNPTMLYVPDLILRIPRFFYFAPLMITLPYITFGCLADLIESIILFLRPDKGSDQSNVWKQVDT
jgi:C4-dicarboxylate transporter, DctQ subunit